MARNSWESDVDVAAMRGGASTGRRIGRVLLWLSGIGVLTFVFAYYLPLLKTHRELLELHRKSAAQAKETTEKLTRVQGELKTAAEKRDQLDKERESRESASREAGQRVDALSTELGGKLAKLAKTVALTHTDTAASVGIPEGVLFAAGKDELSPRARSVLCEVAKAAGTRPLEVVTAPAAATDAAGAEAAWKSAAIRAAAVADGLVSQCSVPAERVSLGVRRSATNAAAGRVAVEVRPAGGS